MKRVLFILLLCNSYVSIAQPPRIDWTTLNTMVNTTAVFAWPLSVSGPATPPSTITPTTSPVISAQWHYAGHNNNPLSEDWIYSMVVTDKKEYIVCGYGSDDEGNPHAGIICKLDHNGNLVWSRAIKNTYSGPTVTLYDFSYTLYPTPTPEYDPMAKNDLWAVAKSQDGYVAVGRGNGILIAEVDEDGNFINGTPIDVIPPAVPTLHDASFSSMSSPGGYGYSVSANPSTHSVKSLVVGGVVGGTGFNGAGLWVLNYHTIYTGGVWEIYDSYYGGDGGSNINKIITKSTGPVNYQIYACGAKSSTYDNVTTSPVLNNADPTPSPYTTFDKDIWVLKSDNTFASVLSSQYDKSNIKVNVSGTPTAINSPGAYTNTNIYPYQETGPLSARNYSTSTGNVGWYDYTISSYRYNSDAVSYLNALNNKNEVGYDMTFTSDGNIVVVGLVNFIGTNPKNSIGYTSGGLVHSGTAGPHPSYGEYSDGDAFLLKINPADIGVTTSSTKAKNVGHFSGVDFYMQVRQDPENNYIVAGSSADQYGSTDYNLPSAAEGEQTAMLVSTNDNWTAVSHDLWRRSFYANDTRATNPGPDGDDNEEDCVCVFAMDVTPDGGFVIGGNNDNNKDDWSITKFAPAHQTLMVNGVGGSYYTFGGTSVPIIHTVSGTEIWSSSRNIASKVVVPNGATLNIYNSTISFAASDHLWDYFFAPDNWSSGTIGCGIVVEPGGTLNIYNSTLQSINIPGEHNVWDGIVVNGNPYSTLPADQGQVTLNGATIVDARYGLFVAQDYRAYYLNGVSTSVSTGYNYSSRYDGTDEKGGGIVTAATYGGTPTTFLNCRYGANFENYGHPNGSSFTNCVFTTDASGMGDICFYTDRNGSILPSLVHVSEWTYPIVTFKDNTFTCNTAFPVSMRPVGISAVEAGILVTNTTSGAGNLFSELSAGIYTSSAALPLRTITITNNTFTDNAYGIKASSVTHNLIVQNNNINVPSYAGYTAVGMLLAGCRGYDVSGNTFDYLGYGVYGDNGIEVNDGSINNESIVKNTFKHIMTANTAMQNNGDDGGTTGLQYRCNNFLYSVEDIYRNSVITGTTPFPATLRYEMGHNSTAASLGAGNQFNFPCTYSGSQERLYGDYLCTQIVDYYNNWGGSFYDPAPCFSDASAYGLWNNVANSTTGGMPTVTSACPAIYDFTNPANSPIWNSGVLFCDAAIAKTTDPYELTELQLEHDGLINALATYYSINGYYDSAAALFARYRMYRDALPFYVMAKDYAKAQDMYVNLPKHTDEDQLYAWVAGLGLNLYASGKTWFDLDSQSIDSMMRIMQYNSPAGYMVGAITSLLGKSPVTWPVPLQDTLLLDTLHSLVDTGSYGYRGAINTKPNVKNNNAKQIFLLYPNPTYGVFTIKSSEEGVFDLYTIEGKLVQSYVIGSGTGSFQLPQSLSSGIYMGKFRAKNNGSVQLVRLVYEP